MWQPLITKTNDHKNSKSLKSDIEWEVHKRTRQGALTILILYIYYRFLVHATTIITCPYVHASSSCPITHPHVFSLRPLCFLHVPWRHTLNLHCTYMHHVYTMSNSCLLMSSLTLTPSRLFPILLDPKSFQTVLASVTWLPGHMPISYLSSIVD